MIISPDDVLMARLGSLMLALISVYVLAYPERFGMRLGMRYYPMPHSPVGRVLGILGLVVGVGIFLLTLW